MRLTLTDCRPLPLPCSNARIDRATYTRPTLKTRILLERQHRGGFRSLFFVRSDFAVQPAAFRLNHDCSTVVPSDRALLPLYLFVLSHLPLSFQASIGTSSAARVGPDLCCVFSCGPCNGLSRHKPSMIHLSRFAREMAWCLLAPSGSH